MTLALRAVRDSSPLSPATDEAAPPSTDSLPEELVKLIVSFLSTADLKNTALVSKSLYRHATEVLWRTVCLADTWKLHLNDENRQIYGNRGDRGPGESDEHDDSPIIQKLYVLATRPHLASQVQILTHRCHLPMPTIFSELPLIHFDSCNLSSDARLHQLLRLAIRNMVNVQTLRIIFGHWKITRTLLEGFLDPNRQRRIPLRKLWLESCSLMEIRMTSGTLEGLESIRFRRLRAEYATRDMAQVSMRFPEYRLERGGHPFHLHDGAGGWVGSTVHFSDEGAPPRRPIIPVAEMNGKSLQYDKSIWDDMPQIRQFLNQNPIPILSSTGTVPRIPMQHFLSISARTLTKLNLDWILWRPYGSEDSDRLALETMHELSKMRFPNLRAFQVRNAVVAMTRLPPDVYLLESTFLNFLEAHPKIQCLAWPLDRFYSHTKPSQDVLSRSRALVAHLGMVLTDLRLDSYYNNNGETFTDDALGGSSRAHERARRRRFIAEFAPHMTKIEQLKLEGGIPRDEKREIIRALHFCPLKKIVMIGVSFPIGNTWGAQGKDLGALDEGLGETLYELEEEDKDALLTAFTEPVPITAPFTFTPSYGWPPSPPFLHTIATHHASTVTELKICGYNGCPILSFSTGVTKPLLHPLQFFDNLHQLVVSLWLLTYFEDDYRDTQIIESWMDTRSPSSTALVVVTPPASPTPPNLSVSPTIMPDHPSPTARPQSYNRWAVALKTQFTPSALAYRVAADIGPYLSPVAKAREGGVRVRASFCLGAREEQRWANDIFDLDIRVGVNDQVLEFVGPREEGERGRWWSKLEGRRWF
ncbi:hypothetical protein B0J11DRAFT_486122 [Dendryphion nanum]|uniref:F-box domain-containing protein n=1 Tax=Dendryphion nanum TaxID=256645 RepID=A0A9P9DXX5_9PLEO|nr:hypothetical protein B0J11DRAFT_486122 [Dendryphion nanum]